MVNKKDFYNNWLSECWQIKLKKLPSLQAFLKTLKTCHWQHCPFAQFIQIQPMMFCPTLSSFQPDIAPGITAKEFLFLFDYLRLANPQLFTYLSYLWRESKIETRYTCSASNKPISIVKKTY